MGLAPMGLVPAAVGDIPLARLAAQAPARPWGVLGPGRRSTAMRENAPAAEEELDTPTGAIFSSRIAP